MKNIVLSTTNSLINISNHASLFTLPNLKARLPAMHPAGERPPRCMGTGAILRTVAVRCRGSGGRTGPSDPDEDRVNRTRLHLTPADDGSRSSSRFPPPTTPLCALVHVQLTRLNRASTARATAPPTPCCTLHASPHPFHSTTGARLNQRTPSTPPTLAIQRKTTCRVALSGKTKVRDCAARVSFPTRKPPKVNKVLTRRKGRGQNKIHNICIHYIITFTVRLPVI